MDGKQQNKNVLFRQEYGIAKSCKWIGAVIIAFVIIVYSSNYFANTFPYSEGWFVNYVELVKHGMYPYKDFFYYLPPLNLLVDTIFWKLSFGHLIIFRVWYLLERVLLYILVYKLLLKFFDWKKVTLACSFSAILCTADDFDFFGDYNQNVALLTVIILYLVVGFVGKNEKRAKYKQLFWAGFVWGLMLLTKQTIFVASGLIFLFLLIFFCINNRDREFIRYIITVIVGMLVPVFVCVIFLLINGSLTQCIEQLFSSADGKGSIYDILVTYLIKTLHNKLAWLFAIIMFVICWKGDNLKLDKKYKKIILSVLAVIVLVTIGYKVDIIHKFYILMTCYKPIFIIVLISFFPILFVGALYFFKKESYKHEMMIIALLFASIVLYFATMYMQNMYHLVYGTAIYRYISGYFNNTIFYLLIILLIYLLIQNARKKKVIANQDEIIMLAGGGLALNYATAMSLGGETIASNSMRISLPLVLVIIFSSNVSKESIGKILKYVISFVCIVGSIACVAQKSIQAYPWWGMKDLPKEKKIYTIDDIPEMEGFYFSKQDKEMYENITRIIMDNSDEDDIIFGYPYIKIYNILCNRYNTYSVPVFWFDVVGDKYVDILIDEIDSRLPEIVVWYDIPNALEVHEMAYRNGKPLEQRKIVDIFNRELPEKYDCLGNYNEMYVYRLRDD